MHCNTKNSLTVIQHIHVFISLLCCHSTRWLCLKEKRKNSLSWSRCQGLRGEYNVIAQKKDVFREKVIHLVRTQSSPKN